MKDPRDTAKKLIETAADERTPEKERVAAGMKAVSLIHQHDLLASPLDGLFQDEVVQEVSNLANSAKKVFERVKKARGRR